MRFSLLHLLLIAPALAVSYLIAPLLRIDRARISYSHDPVINDIRAIRHWAEQNHITNPSINYNEYDVKELWVAVGKKNDPWGNPFQFIERKQPGVFGMKSTFHVYSFGSDGKSKTEGNDLDDINSWNYSRNTYYQPLIMGEPRRKNLWRTFWFTPFTYAAILLVTNLLRKRLSLNENSPQRPG